MTAYDLPGRRSWGLAGSLVVLGFASCTLDERALGDHDTLADATPDVASETTNEADVSSCSDGIRDGDESDVDCGGSSCPHCSDGRRCSAGADCTSGECVSGVCSNDLCSNGVKDPLETDVDCGGPCPPCTDGKSCSSSADCKSKTCASDHRCAPATCNDGVLNGDESDIDCGGSRCPRCLASQRCSVATDCASGSCALATHVCAAPISCKTLLAARPGLASGSFIIDPDGSGSNAPFKAYCEMSLDGGGWTFLAHVAATAPPAPAFLSADVGTYRDDRLDDGTTYGRGGTALPFVGASAALITLDGPDPSAAAAANRLIIFAYAVGIPVMNGGPIPCTGTFTGSVSFRTTGSGPTIACGALSTCSSTAWYPRTEASDYLLLFNAGEPGAFWGKGMGGDDTWGHAAWWYVR